MSEDSIEHRLRRYGDEWGVFGIIVAEDSEKRAKGMGERYKGGNSAERRKIFYEEKVFEKMSKII